MMRPFFPLGLALVVLLCALSASAQEPAQSPQALGSVTLGDFRPTCVLKGVHAEYLRLGGVVARSKMGEQVLLREGMYEVRVLQDERVVHSQSVEVLGGSRRQIEVQWGALSVVSSDRFGQRIAQPMRASHQRSSIAWTTFKQQSPRCWLMPAGVVRLASSRSTGNAGVDVWLPAGKTLSYQLEFNRQSIQSAQVSTRAQPASTPAREPSHTWTIAGHAAFDQNRNRAGVDNVQSLSLGVRSALGFSWELAKGHTLGTTLGFEHARASLGSSLDETVRLRKKRDELRAALLYEWALLPRLSFYAQAWAKAPAFGTYFEPDESVRVLLRDDQGRFGVVPVSAGSKLRLWWPFTPLYTQQEAGARLHLARTHDASVHLSLGAAVRQATYRGGLVLTDRTQDNVDAFRLSDVSLLGPQAGFEMQLNVTDALHVSASVGTLWDIQQMLDRQTPWPLLNVRFIASVDLTDLIALEYVAQIHRDDYQLPEAQVFQGAQIALKYSIF